MVSDKNKMEELKNKKKKSRLFQNLNGKGINWI